MRKCSATSAHILFDFSIYSYDSVGVTFRASERLLAGRQTLATDAGPSRQPKAATDARQGSSRRKNERWIGPQFRNTITKCDVVLRRFFSAKCRCETRC